MNQKTHSTQAMVRRAFGLVMELRAHRKAPCLLSAALAFLEMLARQGDTEAPPLMVSVRVMRLPKT